MKARSIEHGILKVALYPKPYRGESWIPTEAQEDNLFALRGDGWEVEEVASCGAQSVHVLLVFDDFAAAAAHYGEAVDAVCACINA